MPDDTTIEELLELNQRLLESIAEEDWETYSALCDPSLSCFEAETGGHLVEGMEFHRFYFDLGRSAGPQNTTMCFSARAAGRRCGDRQLRAAEPAVQRRGQTGAIRFAETRIWQRTEGGWRHVHFHRSAVGE